MTGTAHTTAPAPRRGSAKSRTVQLRRVLSALAWFAAHPDATLMATAERFGVSVPQLREELTEATYSGLPGLLPGDTVDLVVEGTVVTLGDLQGLGRPLALTATEATTLELNLEKLASILTDDERADADAAAAVLRSLARYRRYGRHTGHAGISGDAAPTGAAESGDAGDTAGQEAGERSPAPAVPGELATLTLLREATATRRWVRLSYLSVSSDTRGVREIIPDTVAVLDGVGYLWGRTDAGQGTADQRCFSVTRMSQVQILDRVAPAACPRTITAADPFGFLDAADAWAELTLTDAAMWMLEYLPVWHIDDTRVEIPDTGPWLDRFLLAYAPEITAVAPAEVAERAADKCAAALAAYRRLA